MNEEHTELKGSEKSTQLSWYDEKCRGGDALDQYLKRKAYHSRYLSSLRGEASKSK